MGEWRPMQTAPRDGTKFLAYCDGEYNCGAEVCSIWFAPFEDGRASWRVCGTEDRLRWAKPLMWMPAPAAPTAEDLRKSTT